MPSSCHLTFVCIKLSSKNLFLSSERPIFYSNYKNPGLRIILFRLPMDFKSPVLNIKIFILFLGAAVPGRSDPVDHPQCKTRLPKPFSYPNLLYPFPSTSPAPIGARHLISPSSSSQPPRATSPLAPARHP